MATSYKFGVFPGPIHFVVLLFQNSLQYRHSDSKIVQWKYISYIRLYANMIKIASLSLEIMRILNALFSMRRGDTMMPSGIYVRICHAFLRLLYYYASFFSLNFNFLNT